MNCRRRLKKLALLPLVVWASPSSSSTCPTGRLTLSTTPFIESER
jgi:hypothetical protein